MKTEFSATKLERATSPTGAAPTQPSARRAGPCTVAAVLTLFGALQACARSSDAGGVEAAPSVDGGVAFADGGQRCGDIPTSVSGIVLSPATTNPDPVYNAVVYVPKGAVDPFPSSLSCDRCGALPSATAWASTSTGADGKFTLKDVPAGRDIPLVVQVGRWRREIVIPEVKACADNVLPAELTRLPRNQKEGNIPRMAVATTYIDPIECVLRKMGVDAAEFSIPSGKGRIHLYQTLGEMGSNGATLGPGTLLAPSLYDDLETLKRYDLVLLPCEAHEAPKSPAALANVTAYADLGGRVFTTHYSYVWLDRATPFSTTALWKHHDPMNEALPDPLIASVDKTFPKGAALADWLVNVGASPAAGVLQLREARHDVDGAVAGRSQRWISSDSPGSVQHLTFNTPVGSAPESACGRVLYSNFHVVENHDHPPGMLFPTECDTSSLSAQERVLEFMLLDLASCVQDDRIAPPR